MSRILKVFLLLLCASAVAFGQAPNGSAPQAEIRTTQPMYLAENTDPDPANHVGEVRADRSLEIGPFGYWGTGIGNRDNYKFFAAGFQIGKPLTPVLRLGVLSGQFELAGNIMPIWQAYTPKAHTELRKCVAPDGSTSPCYVPVGGGTFTGVSLTPAIFRWNFLTRSKRIQPWFQGAGGLIYTTHKFPPDVLFAHGFPGGTSVWNFSPQGGIGLHYFTCSRRSIDISLNAVHISSASLGDRNPGVNAALQVQVGYTWWK